MKESRSRAHRATMFVHGQWLDSFRQDQGLWHESEDDIRHGLAEGRRKRRALRRVRNWMDTRLTKRQRQCLELYYFQGLTFREAGEALGTNATSVHRCVRRALRRLRKAATESGTNTGNTP